MVCVSCLVLLLLLLLLYAASREEKDNIFDTLQQVVNEIPSGELYVILGDFNARARSRMDMSGNMLGF